MSASLAKVIEEVKIHIIKDRIINKIRNTNV